MTQQRDNDTIETGGRRIKFWGVAVIVLMIILMFLPWNIGNPGHQGGSAVLQGTASGDRKVMTSDTSSASAALEMLEGIFVTVGDPTQPGVSEQIPLLTAIWGPERASEMKRHPEAYHLLVQESRKFGLGENPFALGTLDPDAQNATNEGIFNSGLIYVRDLHPLFGSPLYEATQSMIGTGQDVTRVFIPQMTADGSTVATRLSQRPIIQQRQMYAALRDLLAVQSAASISSAAIKPSTVMVDQLLARESQIFTIQAASFDARPLQDSVTVPTDEQLKAQLDKYANVAPGFESAENPFGFGYQVQNAVKLQMLIIEREALRAVVAAEKSDYDWEVEARMAYAKDAKQFKSLASTQPSGATTAPADTEAVAPFDEIKAGAIRMMIDKATDARLDEVSRKIRTTMSLDYQTWATARNTNAATQPSSLGVPYDSVEYLNRLAANIQAEPRFKILPLVRSEQSAFLDAEQLSLDPTLSRMFYRFELNVAQKLGLRQIVIPSAQYLIEFAKPFMDKSTIEKAGSAVLDVMKPSDPLIEFTGSQLAFVRLAAVAPAHPATEIEPIRARLVADVKRLEAQNRAMEQAQKAAQAITNSGKFEVPGATVSTVEVTPPSSDGEIPPQLGLTGRAFVQFHRELGTKLLADPSGEPVAALSVPLAQKVFVVQRIGLKPTWTSEQELAQNRLIVFNGIGARMAEPKSPMNGFGLVDRAVGSDWVDVDAVLTRNDWKPVGSEKTSE